MSINDLIIVILTGIALLVLIVLFVVFMGYILGKMDQMK